MNQSRAMKLAAIVVFVLAAFEGTIWAQEAADPPLALTGRVLFGVADLSEGTYNQGGPAATLGANLSGYWRDPRILQFAVAPTVTVGQAVPGTEMGNALTGFSGVGILLQGSAFPLTVSYSRSSSSFDESKSAVSSSQGVLSGVETGTTNSVFDVNWILRFRYWPTINLNYTDTDYSADLPKGFGGNDDHDLRDITAHLNYSLGGWQAGARYQRSQSKSLSPDILTGGQQEDDDTTTDMGFSAARMLPLNSSIGVNADQSKSDFTFDDSSTSSTVRVANATLASQPVERVSSSVQVQYTSNLQAYQLQQALAGAGLPGLGNSSSTGTTGPLTYLSVPTNLLTLSGGGGIRLGYGFSLIGSTGESHSSNSGTSTRWSAGPAYQYKWRSGWFSANYSHNNMETRSEVVTENVVAGAASTLFSETMITDSGSMNLSYYLPSQFKLAAAAHGSEGTIRDDGIPYPAHDYGGLASLTRPFGEWTLTGALTLEKNVANHELIYNENSAKGASLGVSYRGLNVSGGYQTGSGMAVQVGNGLVWVTNPVVVSPLLGTPVLTSTTGTTMTGSYRSRHARLIVSGDYGHYSYTTNQMPATTYTLLNLHASYRLRRLRLVAGYLSQSQLFSAGPQGTFNARMMYLQVERNFRVF